VLEELDVMQDLLTRHTFPGRFAESIRREISALEREARGVGSVGVTDVIEEIKRRGEKLMSLPSDAGIIDLTTDVFPMHLHPNADND
jgi:hypothetical protein